MQCLLSTPFVWPLTRGYLVSPHQLSFICSTLPCSPSSSYRVAHLRAPAIFPRWRTQKLWSGVRNRGIIKPVWLIPGCNQDPLIGLKGRRHKAERKAKSCVRFRSTPFPDLAEVPPGQRWEERKIPEDDDSPRGGWRVRFCEEV